MFHWRFHKTPTAVNVNNPYYAYYKCRASAPDYQFSNSYLSIDMLFQYIIINVSTIPPIHLVHMWLNSNQLQIDWKCIRNYLIVVSLDETFFYLCN